MPVTPVRMTRMSELYTRADWRSARAGIAIGSVPGQSAQLVEVDVAAGQDDGDARAGGDVDEAVEQRGDRGGRGTLDDELAALHDPDHRLEDVAVGQRDDVVDEALHDRERHLADAAHAQAVDD